MHVTDFFNFLTGERWMCKRILHPRRKVLKNSIRFYSFKSDTSPGKTEQCGTVSVQSTPGQTAEAREFPHDEKIGTPTHICFFKAL